MISSLIEIDRRVNVSDVSDTEAHPLPRATFFPPFTKARRLDVSSSHPLKISRGKHQSSDRGKLACTLNYQLSLAVDCAVALKSSAYYAWARRGFGGKVLSRLETNPEFELTRECSLTVHQNVFRIYYD